MKPDYEEVKKRLLQIVPLGLTADIGKQKPGEMSAEAAICFALNEPHSEQPSCVAGPDREYTVLLNNSDWSSNLARANGLLLLTIAQLGTANTDRRPWAIKLITETVRKILPLAFGKAGMPTYAQACRSAENLRAAYCAAETASRSNPSESTDVHAFDSARNAAEYARNAAYNALIFSGKNGRYPEQKTEQERLATESAFYIGLSAKYAAYACGDIDITLHRAVGIALDAYYWTSNEEPDAEDSEYSALDLMRAHISQTLLAHKKARESGVTAYSATAVIDQLTEILELLNRVQARIDARTKINAK